MIVNQKIKEINGIRFGAFILLGTVAECIDTAVNTIAKRDESLKAYRDSGLLEKEIKTPTGENILNQCDKHDVLLSFKSTGRDGLDTDFHLSVSVFDLVKSCDRYNVTVVFDHEGICRMFEFNISPDGEKVFAMKITKCKESDDVA